MYKRKYQQAYRSKVKHANPRYDSALVSDLPKLGRGKEIKNKDNASEQSVTNTIGTDGELTYWDGTAAATARYVQWQAVTGIKQGSANAERIANKIYLKKICFAITDEETYNDTADESLESNAYMHADGAPYHVLVVLDKQNNRDPATSPFTDFLQDTLVSGDLNAALPLQQVEKTKRFKVLYQKQGKMSMSNNITSIQTATHTVGAGSFQRFTETVQLDLSGITLEYVKGEGNTGHYDELPSNALYIWLILPSAPTARISSLIKYHSRVYYTDQ